MTYEDYKAEAGRRLAVNIRHLEHGVHFIDIHASYIGEEVEIGAGTVIYPGAVLEGKTVIGENCVIGQNTNIKDSTIGSGTDIQHSVITESVVGERTHFV